MRVIGFLGFEDSSINVGDSDAIMHVLTKDSKVGRPAAKLTGNGLTALFARLRENQCHENGLPITLPSGKHTLFPSGRPCRQDKAELAWGSARYGP